MTVALDVLSSKSAPCTTRGDLLAILPPSIRATAEDYLLYQPRMAAALRLLACVETVPWEAAVRSSQIDAWPLLTSIGPYRSDENRDRVLVEAAACFVDPDNVHIPLALIPGRFCEDEDFAILVDALRISREGLTS